MGSSRKSLFYFFAIIYIVFCPLLLLYTLGFFSEVARPSDKTAGVYLDSLPHGASVFLERSRFETTTPTTLEPLLPGEYTVTLRLKDYNDLRYRINILKQQRLSISHALFTPRKLRANRLIDKSFEDLIPLSAGDCFLLREGPNIEDYFVYNWKTKKLQPLMSGKVLPWGTKVLQVFTVTGSSAIVLECNALGVNKYVFAQPKQDDVIFRDITGLVGEDKPQHISWDPDDTSQLFLFNQDHANRLDMTAGVLYENFLEGVRGLGVFGKHVYIVTDINNLKRYDYPKEDLKVLINDPLQGNFIFKNEGFFTIEPLFKDIMMFRGQKGDLALSEVPYRFIESGVKGAAFHAPSRRLLFWQNEKFGMIDMGKEEFGFKEALRVMWLFQGGKELDQLFWVYDGSHVLCKDEDRVFLFEVNSRGLTRIFTVVMTESLTSIYYSEEAGMLYYLEPKTGNLLSTKIIFD